MIASKMIELVDIFTVQGQMPLAWRMRHQALSDLTRQSRHTGDVAMMEGKPSFRGVPIEIGDVRNALGAELLARQA